ncbi:MAG: colanic acid biosynthesis glycosyltransferase WcaL [Ardenticatenaceae bacterium]|nr:MAG: colanic acid biosynthesis glycosyltransferase WcaL [Ardenticatenaceae bacterium]
MKSNSERPKIAYVMSRFPHLPETFILREMIGIEEQGWDVSVYPLIVQNQTVTHEEAKTWLDRVRATPYFSMGLLVANGRFLLSNPGQFITTWGKAIRENIRSPKFLLRTLAILPKAALAAEKMQQENIQHIHAHYATHPALFAWVIHRLTNIPYSITIHAHDIFVTTVMLKTKFNDAAFIAAISEFNSDFIANLVGEWVREKTHIVHCGIEPHKYISTSRSIEKANRFEIISTGSLQPYKGHPFLIEACAILQRQGIPFRCRIIGEGEERSVLERQIAAANLGDFVELLGAQTQSEVARLVASAHCYVQPSIITPSGKMEGIPVSLMEAMSCGLPVISSNLSGISELVMPDQTGFLVSPGDAVALAEAIATVYHNPNMAARLARNGRSHVSAEFNLQKNVNKLAQLFKQYTKAQQLQFSQ